MRTFDQTDSPGRMQECAKTKTCEARQIDEPFTVETMEGTMEGKAGDYLMRGVQGELYVCDQEIFEASYAFVEDGDERTPAEKFVDYAIHHLHEFRDGHPKLRSIYQYGVALAFDHELPEFLPDVIARDEPEQGDAPDDYTRLKKYLTDWRMRALEMNDDPEAHDELLDCIHRQDESLSSPPAERLDAYRDPVTDEGGKK